MNRWRWKNFSPAEVLSPDGLEYYKNNHIKVQGFAMDRLQAYREFLGESISVNHGGHNRRGWRSKRDTANINGAKNGAHEQGIAFDMSCYSLTLPQFYIATVAYSLKKIKEADGASNHMGFRAIGVYPNNNFLHGDFRTLPASKEDYIVLWNKGSVNRSILLYADGAPQSLASLLDLLKNKLSLPAKWRI